MKEAAVRYMKKEAVKGADHTYFCPGETARRRAELDMRSSSLCVIFCSYEEE